jgi:hypothetical protein
MTEMPTVETLGELADLARRHPGCSSAGPAGPLLTRRERVLTGRGPDNEPLVGCDRPVAWIGDRVISEAVRSVEEQSTRWGPLRRPAASERQE